MKKLLFITGTRADFGKLKPLLNYVEEHNEFELHLIVTGMHMMTMYGSTYKEVIKSNYSNMYLIANQFIGEPMGSIFGNTVTLISRLVAEIQPNMMFIHGDRIEALAGATVGALSNCLVCHIEGGELSGTIDDSIRHAVSKLSHIHLVANEQAQNRLLQMGEKIDNIHIIGSPDLDVMQSKQLPTLADVKKHYDIEFSHYALSLFHPVTTESSNMAEYAQQYFDSLMSSNNNYIIIYPNNDTGTEYILSEINKFRNCEKIKIFPSLRFEAFLVLLKHAQFIIGNSSAGIREAPFYGIPTVNVGTRQNRRSQGDSIFNCQYDSADINQSIGMALSYKQKKLDTSFGVGNSVQLFSEIMKQPKIWDTHLQKEFTDL